MVSIEKGKRIQELQDKIVLYQHKHPTPSRDLVFLPARAPTKVSGQVMKRKMVVKTYNVWKNKVRHRPGVACPTNLLFILCTKELKILYLLAPLETNKLHYFQAYRYNTFAYHDSAERQSSSTAVGPRDGIQHRPDHSEWPWQATQVPSTWWRKHRWLNQHRTRDEGGREDNVPSPVLTV